MRVEMCSNRELFPSWVVYKSPLSPFGKGRMKNQCLSVFIAFSFLSSCSFNYCTYQSHTCLPVPPFLPKLSYKYRTKSQAKSSRSKLSDYEMSEMDAHKLRSEFLQVLHSRQSGKVPMLVKPEKPVANLLFLKTNLPSSFEAMNGCPKASIPDFKDKLQEENLYLITVKGRQGRLPLLILSMKENCTQKRPAVVFLHGTSKTKEWLRPLLEAYASRGYVAIAIDSRYRGERARNISTYRDALISAWKRGDTMPFLFDTVWDLIKLADYLTQREDIDPTKIGLESPVNHLEGFRWAIDNDEWQARVDSIKPVFEEARIDLGKPVIDKGVVEKVWVGIARGLASQFDSPYSIPAIAPRPLLILNGAEDPRCPLAGVEVPKSNACKAYADAHAIDNFKLIAQPESSTK